MPRYKYDTPRWISFSFLAFSEAFYLNYISAQAREVMQQPAKRPEKLRYDRPKAREDTLRPASTAKAQRPEKLRYNRPKPEKLRYDRHKGHETFFAMRIFLPRDVFATGGFLP